MKASYRLSMTLYVAVKANQKTRKEEFLVSMAKISARSSMSNRKRLNRGQKLGEYCI